MLGNENQFTKTRAYLPFLQALRDSITLPQTVMVRPFHLH